MVEEVKLKRIKILDSEIFLENLEYGKGKIIINSPYGSSSHYWGAMEGTLEEFIPKTNSYYFSEKLCSERLVFSGKNTAKKIREYIRIEMSYELPWYKFMSAQKDLRSLIKKIETTTNKYEALSKIENLYQSYNYFDLPYKEEKEFISILESHFSQEPWHFLEEDYSQEYKYLMKIHKKLIKIFKS